MLKFLVSFPVSVFCGFIICKLLLSCLMGFVFNLYFLVFIPVGLLLYVTLLGAPLAIGIFISFFVIRKFYEQLYGKDNRKQVIQYTVVAMIFAVILALLVYVPELVNSK